MGFQVCLRKPGLLPRFVQPERLHCGCSLPLISSILGQDPPCSSWRKEKVYFSVSCGCGGRAGGRTQPQQRKQLGVAGAGGVEGRTPACELESGVGTVAWPSLEVGVKGRMGVSGPHFHVAPGGWLGRPCQAGMWVCGLPGPHLRLAHRQLPDS